MNDRHSGVLNPLLNTQISDDVPTASRLSLVYSEIADYFRSLQNQKEKKRERS